MNTMLTLPPNLRKSDDATLAPVPLTDEEVRLLVTALELLRASRVKDRDTLDTPPLTAHGNNAISKADTSEEEILRTSSLHQHLMAEVQYRRRCRVGRQERLAEARARRYPVA